MTPNTIPTVTATAATTNSASIILYLPDSSSQSDCFTCVKDASQSNVEGHIEFFSCAALHHRPSLQINILPCFALKVLF